MDENKIYGTTVINQLTAKTDDSDFIDISEQVSKEELESMREELKEMGKVEETVKTDAFTGIKSSKESPSTPEFKGCRITKSGKDLIKSVINRDLTDEEEHTIAKYFESINITKSEITVDELEKVFPSDLIEKTKEILKTSNNSDKYSDVMFRIGTRLYETYEFIAKYTDDMNELDSISKQIDNYSFDENNDVDNTDDVKSLDNATDKYVSLYDLNTKLNNFINKFKLNRMDERNNKLRQSYTTNDIDIYMVEEIANALSFALSYEKIYSKVTNNAERMKKELSHERDSNIVIENWIDEIRKDPATIYTFPVNDFLSLKESREQIEEYFYQALLASYISENDIVLSISDENVDLESMIRKAGYTDETIYKTLKTVSHIAIYAIAKSFKTKQIVTDIDRRVLSYTLDSISKLGLDDNRIRFTKLCQFLINIFINDKKIFIK